MPPSAKCRRLGSGGRCGLFPPRIATIVHVRLRGNGPPSVAQHLGLRRPGSHQVFSNLKGWARGVYHGLRRKHLQAYLAMSSSFASTAAKPATLLSAIALPHRHRQQCRTPYLQHVDRTGACISGVHKRTVEWAAHSEYALFARFWPNSLFGMTFSYARRESDAQDEFLTLRSSLIIGCILTKTSIILRRKRRRRTSLMLQE